MMFQSITLGGTDKNGQSAVNELSYLALKVEDHMHLDQPNVGVWVHDNVPDDFLEEAARVVARGGGKPMFMGVKSRVQHFMDVAGLPKDAAMQIRFTWVQLYVEPLLPPLRSFKRYCPGQSFGTGPQ